MQPKITTTGDKEDIRESAEPESVVDMSSVMSTMYDGKILDSENVSVHSAFICMLHLANEKGLKFE